MLVWRRGPGGTEVLTRKTLRPAAHFRSTLPLPVPDPRSYLLLEELVAGVLEPEDRGDPPPEEVERVQPEFLVVAV